MQNITVKLEQKIDATQIHKKNHITVFNILSSSDLEREMTHS